MRHLYFNLKDLFSNRKGFVILTSLLRFNTKSREFREWLNIFSVPLSRSYSGPCAQQIRPHGWKISCIWKKESSSPSLSTRTTTTITSNHRHPRFSHRIKRMFTISKITTSPINQTTCTRPDNKVAVNVGVTRLNATDCLNFSNMYGHASDLARNPKIPKSTKSK